jgi:hypothetical protein
MNQQFRTIRPKSTGAPLVLDPADPLKSARAMVPAVFTRGLMPTLHLWRGQFLTFDQSDYVVLDESTLRSKIWLFLDGACQPTADGGVKDRKSVV